MTAAEIVSCVRITDVALALGQPIRHGRTIATWREGEHHNVSLNDSRGCWHDFVTGESGGVLDLIARVRGGTRADALGWLADFAGVPLDDRRITVSERQQWARRRAAAEREADRVAGWRDEVLASLRARRDQHQHFYHFGLRWIIRHGLTDEHSIAIADVTDGYEAGYRRLDEHLATLRDGTPGDWAYIWREQMEAAA